MGSVVAGFGVALLLLLGTGCTSTTEPADGGPDGGPAGVVCLPLDAGLPAVTAWRGVDAGPDGEPLERFAFDYYSAFCDGMSRCFPFEPYLIPNCVEQLQSFGIWVAPTLCGPIFAGTVCSSEGLDLTSIEADVAAVGTGLSYDSNAAAACLAAPWTLCPERYNDVSTPPPCGAVFGGLVPDGGACEFDLECAVGACSRPGGGCAGMCAPPSTPPPPVVVHPGSFCAFGAGCGEDAGLTCDGQFCRGDAGVGDLCGPHPFYGFYQCSAGLFCDPASGSCQPQIAQGGACLTGFLNQPDEFGRCAPGLACAGEASLVDGGARPGTCQPPAHLGGPCVEILPDELEHTSGCVVGGACSCGVCVPPPTSGACADGWTPCLLDVSACDYVGAGSCLPLSSFGSCSNGQQCTNGYCASGTCTDNPLLDACPG